MTWQVCNCFASLNPDCPLHGTPQLTVTTSTGDFDRSTNDKEDARLVQEQVQGMRLTVDGPVVYMTADGLVRQVLALRARLAAAEVLLRDQYDGYMSLRLDGEGPGMWTCDVCGGLSPRGAQPEFTEHAPECSAGRLRAFLEESP